MKKLLAMLLVIALMLTSVAGAIGETEENLDSVQRNSINMLNYISVLMQEINSSSESRIYLEEAYSLLINNTYPNAVDANTLAQMTAILDMLEGYRMVSVKRDRIEYVREQNQAQALWTALVPDPLGLLSHNASGDGIGRILSCVYTGIKGVATYAVEMNEVELEYLQDGWELDDEAATILHNSRRDTFSYMIRMVGMYDLPGDLALNEQAIDEFVSWRNNPNAVQRIRFLEANADTYRAVGMYWLTLAESYYEVGDYTACLESIAAYESIATRIFRKDYSYANVLPLAIDAAAEVLSAEEYIETAGRFASLILENTDYSDWAMHYFVVQTYVELYALTDDIAYLEQALALTVDNVNVLVNEQRTLNAAYLAPVAEQSVPADATKAVKDEIKDFNKFLKQERKTALAPIYWPLVLNCDLMFALARELDLPEEEMERIDGILRGNEEPLFLAVSVERYFSFEETADEPLTPEVDCAGKTIELPVWLVTEETEIHMLVEDPASSERAEFTDWSVEKVERPKDGEFSDFVATYKSGAADKFKFVPGQVITVTVKPTSLAEETYTFIFNAVSSKALYVFDTVEFEKAE